MCLSVKSVKSVMYDSDSSEFEDALNVSLYQFCVQVTCMSENI